MRLALFTGALLLSTAAFASEHCPLPMQSDVLNRCVCPQPDLRITMELYKLFPELAEVCPLRSSGRESASSGWGPRRGKQPHTPPSTCEELGNCEPPPCETDCEEPEEPNGPPCGTPPCGNFYGNDREDNNEQDENNPHNDGTPPGPPCGTPPCGRP